MRGRRQSIENERKFNEIYLQGCRVRREAKVNVKYSDCNQFLRSARLTSAY